MFYIEFNLKNDKMAEINQNYISFCALNRILLCIK